MRPASSRVITLWITVLCLLTALFSLNGLASAQAAASKRKLSQQSVASPQPVISAAAARKASARKATPNALPPGTTDTWTGGGGANTDWSDPSNWNNGAITTGENIAIGLTTAATTIGTSESFDIGTLTLSNTGDSVTLGNNATLEVGGNISNAGTITFNAAGNVTGLELANSLTLSGGGTINLTSTNSNYSGYVYGTAGAVLTTSSNIVGAGIVGNGELNFVNSGTINANISGQTLEVNPDTCTGCTNTNTGTLEATGGGTLVLNNGTWTNTGGKITAAASSAVDLENNVSITGGTLSTTGSGVIYDVVSNDIFLTNVTNTGNYTVQNNAATEISGTLTNTGTITLAAAGNVTELYLTGNTTLTGSGTVQLSTTNNDWTGYINGVSGAVLTNQTTVEGWGIVGNGTLEIANASNGVINANISGGNILLNPITTLTSTNAGLMEATNGGTLTMSNGTWNNTGTIQAAAGSSVVLQSNVSITGGTLESTGTGVVYDLVSNDVFLTGLTLAGTYDIQNNAATEISGTITNNATINVQAAGNVTGLYVNPAGSNSAILTGTGTVILGSTNGSYTGYIYGTSGGSLTIDQQISGAGNVGDGLLTLTNNSTINANLSPTVTTTPLTIEAGGGGMANNGTLEATNGGNLTLSGSTITNASGGIIEAVGTDGSNNPSTVVLTAGVSVTGGTLTTTGAGVIEVAVSNIANLANLTNSGTLNVLNNGQIDSTGTITNNGTITLQAEGDSTYFYAANSTTLTGSGTLVMGSPNQDYTGVVETAGGMTLTNDETITGAGSIQDGTFINNGTVNANVSGQSLTLQTFTAATNTKSMEASNGGTLIFNGSSWNNAGGTITAQTGSSVDLTGNVTITGGTLTSAGTGQVYVAVSNVANLTSLTNSGTLNVQNNAQIDSTGTITNNGTITLQAAGNQTYFYAPNATTLTGTGTLVMSSTNNDYTANVDAAGGLTNDETITGAGQIDSGVFINNGTINANVSGQTLLLTGFAAGTANTKTMEASGGGTMEFNGSSWTNTGGTIEAQTGSAVNLEGSVTITGGTLTTSGTGAINVLVSNDVFLSGLTNSGTLNVQNNAQLNFTGTMTNNGTVNIQGAGDTTYLIINGSVTLNGSGTIDLTSTNSDYTDAIYGEGTAPILISHNTIEGAGNLGSGNMGFTNDGTVDANVAGQAININVDSTGFTNWNGTTNTLTGGTYIANGGNITFASGGTTGITTLSASVTEENGGQILDSSNSDANALANLTSITSTGSLTTDVNFTDAGAFSNAGSLTILGGTTFNVGSLAQISGTTLTAGTYVLDSNLNLTGTAQTITTNAATLTLAGGTIENTSNTTNALAGLASNTGKLTIAGAANNVSTSAANFSNTGTLTINGGDSFTAHALTQLTGSNSSKTLSAGTYVLAGNLDLTTTGISITTNSANLTLSGGTIKSGSANALGALAANTANLTIAGTNKSITTSAASFSNTGTLTIDKTDSFTAGNLTQISSGTLSGGTYVLAGNLDLTTAGISVTTNSANLTLEGGTINSNNVNALSALAANTSSLTIAGTTTSVTTSAASFSNTGTLTIDAGDSFVAPALTQISGSTLTAGTYILAGNLDLTAAANITTNSANLTLEGGSIETGSTNDLANLASNTNSLTLASKASFTATGNFSNSGKLTIDSGSTFTLTGTNVLTNLSSGTLSGGTYTIGGTLQLTSTNGGITSNAANLTLTGTAAKIMDGTSNALSGFDNNASTGKFTLSGDATLTTATSNFSNAGTVTVSKGSTLTVGGSNNYNQTAGTTTVDGTLLGASITAMGGSIFGAGTLQGNTSIGNATGAAATLNVGDNGKAGLLAITGNYTQLATGKMNVSIGGLTTGTYSELTVSGLTSLGGTLTVAIVNGLVLTSANIGTQFVVLSSTGTLSGSFTNATVTVGTDEFSITYVGNTVVLTLTSVTAAPGGSSSPAKSAASTASAEPAVARNSVAANDKRPILTSGLRHRENGVSTIAKPIMVAGLAPSGAHRGGLSNLRSWEHIPVVSTNTIRPVAVSEVTGANPTTSRTEQSLSDLRLGQMHGIGTQSTLAGWMGTTRRPVKTPLPLLPRAVR
jgi:fibronectin-binding autotransporter adhesin